MRLKLATLKQLIPAPLLPLARSAAYFGHRARVRAWVLSESWKDRRRGLPADVAPAWLRYKVGESPDLDLFLEVGRRSADNIMDGLAAVGRSPESVGPVLDFGCGCGRTLIWLKKRLPDARFCGCDTDGQTVDWCSGHLGFGEFRVNAPLPPLDYPDGTFDAIYAISVFTHLDEDFQFRWIEELVRKLRPGGVLLFSVHGRAAWKGLGEADIRELEGRGFLFKSSSKLKGIFPDWYHTTYHSEEYVREKLGKYFREMHYLAQGMGYQDLVAGVC